MQKLATLVEMLAVFVRGVCCINLAISYTQLAHVAGKPVQNPSANQTKAYYQETAVGALAQGDSVPPSNQ